jgi:cleavage and polyadenylation specificity factor subunit 1
MKIDTYEEKILELQLSLSRSFKWNFVIDSAQSPIISADYLSQYGLLIDLKNHRPIDTVTSLKIYGKLHHTSEFGNSTFNKTLLYNDLIGQFMSVTTTSSSKSKSGTSVLHHIVTTGPPIAERPRRLTGEKLTSVKVEFDYM